MCVRVCVRMGFCVHFGATSNEKDIEENIHPMCSIESELISCALIQIVSKLKYINQQNGEIMIIIVIHKTTKWFVGVKIMLKKCFPSIQTFN